MMESQMGIIVAGLSGRSAYVWAFHVKRGAAGRITSINADVCEWSCSAGFGSGISGQFC